MRTGILILFPEANKTQDDNREVTPGEKLLSYIRKEQLRTNGHFLWQDERLVSGFKSITTINRY